MARKTCTACAIAPVDEIRFCHECDGKGYIEDFGDCKHLDKDCEYEPMTNGWLCKCGASGPLY